MIQEICQEMTQLTKDRLFMRNLGIVGGIVLISSASLALGSASSERLAKKARMENLSNLMSVGLSIRTQTILGK